MRADITIIGLVSCWLFAACSADKVEFGDDGGLTGTGGLELGSGGASGSGGLNGYGTGGLGSGGDGGLGGLGTGGDDSAWGRVWDDLVDSNFDDGGVQSVDDLYGDDWDDWLDWASDQDPNGWMIDGLSPWCENGAGLAEERCGNGRDDDCDGTADEFEGGICWDGCDPGYNGSLLCDPITGDTLCHCLRGASCGNHRVDQNEECDTSAGDIVATRQSAKQLEPYCTQSCELDTKFGACGVRYQVGVEDGPRKWATSFPESYTSFGHEGGTAYCQEGTRCNHQTFSCLPWIGDYWQHCPLLKRPAEVYVDGDSVTFTYRWYATVEVAAAEDQPEMCMITCRDDEECPTDIPYCYQQICNRFSPDSWGE